MRGGYRLLGQNRAGFRVGPYDRRRPLLIDPILSYAATFGTADTIQGIATDPAGNVYIAGTTASGVPLLNPITRKPTSPNCAYQPQRNYRGCENVFVAKFDPTGTTLLYSTFLGDTRDFAAGIAVGPDGSAYVAGTARAVDFQVPRDGQAWVRKLNPSGSAVVYYSALNGDTAMNAIAVDAQGNAYIAGSSLDLSFPAVNAVQPSPLFRSLLVTNEGGATWRALPNLHALTVSSLAIDPAHSNTLYAATSSGVFKSLDAGVSWTQVLPDAKSASYVVLDPSSRIYVIYSDSASASQIAKSVDGGATWQALTAIIPLRFNSPHQFGRLALDPENPSVLWLTDFPQIGPTIYRSADGGANWSDGHDFPAFFNGTSLREGPMFVDPMNASRVYACCVFPSLQSGTASTYRTEDGGNTWVKINCAVDAIDSKGVLYGFCTGLGRSSDHGQTWTSISLTSGSLSVTAADVLLVLDGGILVRSADGAMTWTDATGSSGGGGSILASDAQGATVYVGSPASTPVQHGFAAKLDAGGTVLWATLLAGSRQDEARAIAVDQAGSAYVAGSTRSPDFPLVNPFQNAFGDQGLTFDHTDAFLSKISSDGTKLLYSTFAGNYAEANAVAVDLAGNAYIAGRNGASFVSKFDVTGRNRLFSTYLGGSPYGDAANAIAVDSHGAIWVGGLSETDGFPQVNSIPSSFGPGYSGYLARLSPSGIGFDLDFSTYLGGVGGTNDAVAALAASSTGAVWVAGTTPPYYMPGANGALLARFDPESPPAPTAGVPAIRSICNAASFQVAAAVSPGELVALMGAELAPATVSAQGLPLPMTLQGVEVDVSGIAAPLLYVSPAQINFQVPYNIPQGSASIIVRRGTQQSAGMTVVVLPSTPGIFGANGDPTSPVVVHASDYSMVTVKSPAHRGEYLAIFCDGLGLTKPPVSAGNAVAAATPITGAFQVVLDWAAVGVAPYAGLAPGFAGLYQVDFQVPTNAKLGSDSLYVSIYPGALSNQVQLYISGAP